MSEKPTHPCLLCPAYALNMCATMMDIDQRTNSESVNTSPSVDQTVPARRIVCRTRDLYDDVPILCQGWAASAVTLSDGSRQILSFLLPGELVSSTLVFDTSPYCLVEAITDVRYRTFKRADFKRALLENPEAFDKFARTWVEEKLRADDLAIDLGRRSADERIVRLILSFKERLSRRGMVDGASFEFPLRQHHIADATGLTPVHVSKVLSEFRRAGLIEVGERTMTIRDLEKFRRIATMR